MMAFVRNIQVKMKETDKECKNKEIVVTSVRQTNNTSVAKRLDSNTVTSDGRAFKKIKLIPNFDIPLIKYVMWENDSNLCWLDASMALLVHSKTMRRAIEYYASECQIAKVIKCYDENNAFLNELIAKNNVESDLRIIRKKLQEVQESALNYLQPILKCKKGEPDSAFCALYNLITEDKLVRSHFDIVYSWVRKCDNCKSHREIKNKKPIITISRLSKFNPEYPSSLFQCCENSNQEMKLHYKNLPSSLIFHFENGAGNGESIPRSFSIENREYDLTSIMTLEKSLEVNVNHFVTWIRDAATNYWLECNDLNSDLVSFVPEIPIFDLKDLYIVGYEAFDNLGTIHVSDAGSGKSPVKNSDNDQIPCIDIADDSEKTRTNSRNSSRINNFSCPAKNVGNVSAFLANFQKEYSLSNSDKNYKLFEKFFYKKTTFDNELAVKKNLLDKLSDSHNNREDEITKLSGDVVNSSSVVFKDSEVSNGNLNDTVSSNANVKDKEDNKVNDIFTSKQNEEISHSSNCTTSVKDPVQNHTTSEKIKSIKSEILKKFINKPFLLNNATKLLHQSTVTNSNNRESLLLSGDKKSTMLKKNLSQSSLKQNKISKINKSEMLSDVESKVSRPYKSFTSNDEKCINNQGEILEKSHLPLKMESPITNEKNDVRPEIVHKNFLKPNKMLIYNASKKENKIKVSSSKQTIKTEENQLPSTSNVSKIENIESFIPKFPTTADAKKYSKIKIKDSNLQKSVLRKKSVTTFERKMLEDNKIDSFSNKKLVGISKIERNETDIASSEEERMSVNKKMASVSENEINKNGMSDLHGVNITVSGKSSDIAEAVTNKNEPDLDGVHFSASKNTTNNFEIANNGNAILDSVDVHMSLNKDSDTVLCNSEKEKEEIFKQIDSYIREITDEKNENASILHHGIAFESNIFNYMDAKATLANISMDTTGDKRNVYNGHISKSTDEKMRIEMFESFEKAAEIDFEVQKKSGDSKKEMKQNFNVDSYTSPEKKEKLRSNRMFDKQSGSMIEDDALLKKMKCAFFKKESQNSQNTENINNCLKSPHHQLVSDDAFKTPDKSKGHQNTENINNCLKPPYRQLVSDDALKTTDKSKDHQNTENVDNFDLKSPNRQHVHSKDTLKSIDKSNISESLSFHKNDKLKISYKVDLFNDSSSDSEKSDTDNEHNIDPMDADHENLMCYVDLIFVEAISYLNI